MSLQANCMMQRPMQVSMMTSSQIKIHTISYKEDTGQLQRHHRSGMSDLISVTCFNVHFRVFLCPMLLYFIVAPLEPSFNVLWSRCVSRSTFLCFTGSNNKTNVNIIMVIVLTCLRYEYNITSSMTRESQSAYFVMLFLLYVILQKNHC